MLQGNHRLRYATIVTLTAMHAMEAGGNSSTSMLQCTICLLQPCEETQKSFLGASSQASKAGETLIFKVGGMTRKPLKLERGRGHAACHPQP